MCLAQICYLGFWDTLILEHVKLALSGPVCCPVSVTHTTDLANFWRIGQSLFSVQSPGDPAVFANFLSDSQACKWSVVSWLLKAPRMEFDFKTVCSMSVKTRKAIGHKKSTIANILFYNCNKWSCSHVKSAPLSTIERPKLVLTLRE